jgi:hypothetical protein
MIRIRIRISGEWRWNYFRPNLKSALDIEKPPTIAHLHEACRGDVDALHRELPGRQGVRDSAFAIILGLGPLRKCLIRTTFGFSKSGFAIHLAPRTATAWAKSSDSAVMPDLLLVGNALP